MEEDKIIIYQTEDGQTQIDVRLENDTVWLNSNRWFNYSSHRELIFWNISNIFMKSKNWIKFQLVGISDRFKKKVTVWSIVRRRCTI